MLGLKKGGFSSIDPPGDLFVAGGNNALDDAEVIDLNPDNLIQTPCFKPSDLAFEQEEHVGIFSLGQPWLCGGESRQCQSYDAGEDEWTERAPLDQERRLGASVQISETEWWISGGDRGDNVGLIDSIIYRTDTETYEDYVDLPIGMWRHVMVKVDDDTYFVMGSDQDQDPEIANRGAYLFDRSSGEYETLEVPFDFNLLLGFAGLVTRSDGTREVVATGGYYGPAQTAILDVDSRQWRQGPPMPSPTFGGASVPYGPYTFLAVGGNLEAGGYSNLILTFDPDSEEWVRTNRVLTTEREWFAPVVAPTGFLDCDL